MTEAYSSSSTYLHNHHTRKTPNNPLPTVHPQKRFRSSGSRHTCGNDTSWLLSALHQLHYASCSCELDGKCPHSSVNRAARILLGVTHSVSKTSLQLAHCLT